MDLLHRDRRACGRRRGDRQRPRRRPARRGHPAARRLVASPRRRRDRLAVRRLPARTRRRATIGSSSPRSCRRRCSAKMAAAHGVHSAETFTGFKWIARERARPPRAALRVRLRAGARLPRRRAAARQGRHHRGRAVRRDRGCRRGRRPHAAGVARRHRRPVRPARARRRLGADDARRRRRQGGRRCRPTRRPQIGGRAVVEHRGVSRRPICSGSSSRAACGCRSARAAPSRRSSSTAKRSTRTRRRSSTRSPHCSTDRDRVPAAARSRRRFEQHEAAFAQTTACRGRPSISSVGEVACRARPRPGRASTSSGIGR